ncbi:MAG TPA: hypothetical protein VJ716_07950 [Gaiellaceae bacterium]|nr:hypothetical protein [Gaiellaceae bacterium]
MRATIFAAILLLALVAAGCGGSHPVAAKGRLLAGQVQVVWYSDDNVRICPNFATALDFGPVAPPPCADGLRVVGVDTSLLTEHAQGKTEHWGYLYLVGSYHDDVFTVQSQRLRGPSTQPMGSSLDKPPCPAPRGGWVLASRTQLQQRTIEHYSHFAHHHDLVSIAFFDHGSVLTVASSHPARTRQVLGRYWPRQLCVVKARYSRATLVSVGRRLERLMGSRRSPELGWITGAGGTGPLNDDAQPTTSVQVLLETPQLRALLRRLPRGLVVVDAALRPVGRA